VDYFQGVVTEYLRADRSCFINPEFWLRGNLDKSKQYEKPHWYVDVLAVHMRLKQVFLCEVTYAKKAPALIARLKSWREHWPVILQTLREDASLSSDWPVFAGAENTRDSFLKALRHPLLHVVRPVPVLDYAHRHSRQKL